MLGRRLHLKAYICLMAVMNSSRRAYKSNQIRIQTCPLLKTIISSNIPNNIPLLTHHTSSPVQICDPNLQSIYKHNPNPGLPPPLLTWCNTIKSFKSRHLLWYSDRREYIRCIIAVTLPNTTACIRAVNNDQNYTINCDSIAELGSASHCVRLFECNLCTTVLIKQSLHR